MPQKSAYPRPGDVGGRLIRDVIGFLKKQNIELPITSHILIAVSGGPDSMALAHLLLKYGRRIAPQGQIGLLHVNHGWREKSSADARFVARFAQEFEVPILTKKLKPPTTSEAYEGKSWEEVAREARKQFFQEAAEKRGAIVLTAHQADDLAETLLWRLFTGAATTHGGGITVRHGVELRPFLTQRKSTLEAYLKEEGQGFCQDETNRDERFLRARMRAQMIPIIEKIFPRAIQHLVKLGLEAQARGTSETEWGPELLFQAAGIRGRRAHLEALLNGRQDHLDFQLDLPGGWKLTREKRKTKNASQQASERWTLERNS